MTEVSPTEVSHSEVAVIGAGFAGLTMAHALGLVGVDDVVLFERADGVGGTWRANSYPGAACDVPSHLYSLSFAPKPDWSRSYASQPEILDYLEDCYDRFDVRRKVRLGTTVVAATWQDDVQRWRLRDATGAEHESRVLVSAIGLFHTPVEPDIDGLADFGGTRFHSARWDHTQDLTGRRVAVIGTGASAIQVVPAIAPVTEHLDVYQRTPAWILPRKDEPFSEEDKRRFADDPVAARAIRDQLYNEFESATTFVHGDPVGALIADIARGYLERKVPDPELRARLTPDYPLGCKRTLISSAFYPAIQRHDVTLVTDRIERVTPTGIVTGDGTERPCDTIVLCTGFRATEYLRDINVSGRGGTDLHDHWKGVPRAYLGMAVPGFPNLFLMYGPNTNQGGNSILIVLEAQARYIAEAVRTLRERDATSIEVRPDAMRRYVDALEASLADTVWSDGVDSYFRTGAGDIVTQLPHSAGWYCERTARLELHDFTFAPTAEAELRRIDRPLR
jgi:cation diffusion facilitator CzcD-associated flavoprotein CzcO